MIAGLIIGFAIGAIIGVAGTLVWAILGHKGIDFPNYPSHRD